MTVPEARSSSGSRGVFKKISDFYMFLDGFPDIKYFLNFYFKKRVAENKGGGTCAAPLPHSLGSVPGFEPNPVWNKEFTAY